jgi:alanyl-tRNA synthetase
MTTPSNAQETKTITITSGDKEYTVEYTIIKTEGAAQARARAEDEAARKIQRNIRNANAKNLDKKQPLNMAATTAANSPFDGAAAVTAAAAGVNLKHTGKYFPNMNNAISLADTAAKIAKIAAGSQGGGRPTPPTRAPPKPSTGKRAKSGGRAPKSRAAAANKK